MHSIPWIRLSDISNIIQETDSPQKFDLDFFLYSNETSIYRVLENGTIGLQIDQETTDESSTIIEESKLLTFCENRNIEVVIPGSVRNWQKKHGENITREYVKWKTNDLKFWLDSPGLSIWEICALLLDENPERLNEYLDFNFPEEVDGIARHQYQHIVRSAKLDIIKARKSGERESDWIIDSQDFFKFALRSGLELPLVLRLYAENQLQTKLDHVNSSDEEESISLSGKEKQELGNLRIWKGNHQNSIKMAVSAAFFCFEAGQHQTTRKELTIHLEETFSSKAFTLETFEQIWKSIPNNYRKGPGRRKNR